jgi:hypothetical protein
MYKVYDFRCPNGHVVEKFVPNGTRISRCDCGAKGTRMVSAPAFILDGSSGDFPGRHMRWVREHEKAGQNSNLHND